MVCGVWGCPPPPKQPQTLAEGNLEYRVLGKTNLKVSVLGFGCGGVGGIIIADDYPLILRAVARAVELGINYFDTAQLYGNGRSEEHLGKALSELKPDVVVGTKVRLFRFEPDEIKAEILKAAETSLRRLGRERLDLFQVHNPIYLENNVEKGWAGVPALQSAVEAFQKLQTAGKIRYWGINGIGDTAAIHQGLVATPADTIQVCYNLLNPSAWVSMPENYSFQNYQGLMRQAADRQVGVIAFRVLAGGALTARPQRHPVAARVVEPIASSSEYETDVALSANFQYLVSENWAGDMAEAAIRFAITRPEISTIPIGFSSLDQLEGAVKAVERGPLPGDALERLPAIWSRF
jgi:aryl-alcohol dehydrogenase-like predicted oxidoreductase